MSKYTVVGHSDAKPKQQQPVQQKKPPTSDFLKNIIKANVTRTATVQKAEVPVMGAATKTESESKVSFGAPSSSSAALTKSAKFAPTTTTTPSTPLSSAVPKKSALKKTEHLIPIQKSALVDSYHDDGEETAATKPATKQVKTKSASFSTPTPTKTTTPLKSTTTKDSKVKIEEKPTKKAAMPGFFSAGTMPEFGSAALKFEKRKKPTKSASKTTTKVTQDTSKKQKANDTTANKSTFFSSGQMDDYSGDDDDDDDVADSDEERMKAMFGDDNDDSEPEFGVYGDTDDDDDDDSEDEKRKVSKKPSSVTKSTKNQKVTAQTKVQLGKKVVRPQDDDDEEEMDGFMSDDDDDEIPPPQPKKQVQTGKKVVMKAEVKKATKKAPKQEDSEIEMDGFMSDDDDEMTTNNNNQSNTGDSSEEEEKEQQTRKQPTKKVQSEETVIPTVTFTPQQLAAIPTPPLIPNNTIPFSNAPTTIPHTTATLHSTPITLYYPLEANPKKQKKKIEVECFEINYFQNNLHSVLSYPYLNTLKETLFFILQSEVHSRYLFEYLPSNFTPRHNLVTGPSTLHNSTNNHLLLILNEEMIRYQQSSSLYGKFQRTFNALKDNSFNNYEQWVIRNLSILPKVLPNALASFQNRKMLFEHLKSRKVAPQAFMPPTIFDKFTLRTMASRSMQAERERDSDILFGAPTITLADAELRDQLKMRGTDDSRGSGGPMMSKKYSKEDLSEVDLKMLKFSKALKSSIDEIKNLQNQLSAKGCHHKDTIVKVTEDINKNAMNQDVTVLYKYIAQFDRVSITFHTGIGPIALSIPHTVKLIILYISSMIVNNCLDDDILNKMMKLDHNNINSTNETEQGRVDIDYPILNEILSTALPYLESNFTPIKAGVNNNSNAADDGDDENMIEVDGQKFRIDQQDLDLSTTDTPAPTQPTQVQLAPQLTKQVAHILTQIQFKLPPQSIIYQYISMILTGLQVIPKIPNLKNPTTQIPGFPQPIAQAIVSVLFRYDALHGGQQYQGGGKGNTTSSGTGGGNQAAVPPMFLQKCGELLDVNIEAFASPLNAYFNTYCSAFADTDVPFGSLGSFFHFRPTSGSIFVNPPFASNTILASVIHAEQLLAVSEREPLYASQRAIETQPKQPIKGKTLVKQQPPTTTIKPLPSPLTTQLHSDKGLTFVFVFPYKDDELFTQWITSSPYCQFFAILPSRQHVYTIGRQETNINKKEFYRPARHDTILAILQNEKATKANKVTPDIVKALLKNFLVHIPLRGAAANINNVDDLMNLKPQQKNDGGDDAHLFDPILFGLDADND